MYNAQKAIKAIYMLNRKAHQVIIKDTTIMLKEEQTFGLPDVFLDAKLSDSNTTLKQAAKDYVKTGKVPQYLSS